MSKVILWDWDNTLADTFGAIFAAQNDARVQYGMTPWTKEESKAAMNTSGRNLIKDVFGADKAAEVRAYFLSRYAEHADALELKAGAKEILKTAKELGFVNILASNKAGPILRNEVSAMGVADYFDRLIGAEEAEEDKPSKIFTDTALAGIEADMIISIGDGKADIQMAHNYAGGIGILVWTNPNGVEFAEIKPDYAVENLAKASEILKKI
ncbi:MAG: HAD family hydrolase [Alphaproteobacteria bacterium]|nr:HAD family hydrolase [Alphaproteobacteria bacterium]